MARVRREASRETKEPKLAEWHPLNAYFREIINPECRESCILGLGSHGATYGTGEHPPPRGVGAKPVSFVGMGATGIKTPWATDAPAGLMARLVVMEETMIGTVIVPLDGSELAEQAVPFAATIARGLGVPLELLRVVPAGAAGGEDEARVYLDHIRERVGDQTQVTIQTGQPAAQIIAAAEAATEPLIIMTTHGRGGIGRLVFGSVADQILRGITAPVLLIRSGTATASESTVQTIMVPLDGSEFSEVALPYAELLARVFHAEVRLVRVVEATYVADGTVLAPAMAAEAIPEVRESAEYLANVAQPLRDNGIRVQTQILEGFPTNQLLAYEKESGADLAVMATHSRTGLSRLVYGSVAERVLNNGTVPVLMVRPKE